MLKQNELQHIFSWMLLFWRIIIQWNLTFTFVLVWCLEIKKFNFLMSCPWWFPSFGILQRVQNIQWNAWITTIEGLKLKNCHCRLHSIKSISHAHVQNHFLAICLSDHSGHEKQWLWLSSGTVFTLQCPPDQGQSILPTNIQFSETITHFWLSFSLSMVCIGGWNTSLYSRGPFALLVGVEPNPQSPKHPTTLIFFPPPILIPSWWLWKHVTEPVTRSW